MKSLTIRMTDDKLKRLMALAEQRNTSASALITETITALLADYDSQIRFGKRSRHGSDLGMKRGIKLIEKATTQTK